MISISYNGFQGEFSNEKKEIILFENGNDIDDYFFKFYNSSIISLR